MFSDWVSQLQAFMDKSQGYLEPWLITFGVLWLFNIIHWAFRSPLNILGIYPRHLLGLVGILFSPILHQNFSHLFFNSIPLFALGLVVLTQGLPIFLAVTGIIIFLGGVGVWVLGRKAMHIGASGLVSGYFGYILAMAYFEPSIVTVILALIVVYYFGSIFLGIFPQEEKISWESHFFGFLSGILTALIIPSIGFFA